MVFYTWNGLKIVYDQRIQFIVVFSELKFFFSEFIVDEYDLLR